MDWTVPSQNSDVEALILNVAVFENKAFREVIKFKWGHKYGSVSLENPDEYIILLFICKSSLIHRIFMDIFLKEIIFQVFPTKKCL